MRTSVLFLIVSSFSLFACSESLNHLVSKVANGQAEQDPFRVLSGIDFCALAPHNFEDGVEQQAFTRMRLSDGNDAEDGQIGWLLGPSGKETPMIVASAIDWDVSPSSPMMRSLKYTKMDIYAGDVKAKLRLSLPTDLQNIGDLDSLQTFFDNAFSISLRFDSGQKLTGLPEGWVVNYGPCSRSSLRDAFVFEFKGGDILTAEIVTANGALGNGYYVGFLISMSGSWRGNDLNLSEFDRLYMHGSTKSWAQRSIPTLSVRWAESGEEDGSCGIVFSTRQWYASDAVRGYKVYDLRCNGKLGSIRNLIGVSYADHYVLP